jgi:copper(I)-binding protein
MKSLKTLTLFAAAMLFMAPAFAQTSAQSLTVTDAYVRAPAPSAPSTGAFMVIRNGGTAERRVLKAHSNAARVVELHTHRNEGGVMKMRPVADIAVAAGGETILKPGGLHVMLIDLQQPLKEGDVVPITLSFDDGSTVKVDAPVKKLQMMMPGKPDPAQ